MVIDTLGKNSCDSLLKEVGIQSNTSSQEHFTSEHCSQLAEQMLNKINNHDYTWEELYDITASLCRKMYPSDDLFYRFFALKDTLFYMIEGMQDRREGAITAKSILKEMTSIKAQ